MSASDARSARAAAPFRAAYLDHQHGRLQEACRGYERVVAIDDAHADAWHLLGVVHAQLGHAHQAEAHVRRALAVRQEPLFHKNLGQMLAQWGRHADAAQAYQRAIELRSDDIEACNALGLALVAAGRFAEAEAAFRHGMKVDPRCAAVARNLGNVLAEAGRLDDAAAAYRQCLAIAPHDADAQYNLGVVLDRADQLVPAEAAARCAIALRPAMFEARVSLANILRKTRQYVDAEAELRAAIALRPDASLPHCNLGNLCRERGRAAEAEQAYRRAIDVNAGDAAARYNLSLLLLALGRYAEAWPMHEVRYDAALSPPISRPPSVSFPPWQGESLVGKSLLVWHEQGHGDNIQFARYAQSLKAAGLAHLTWGCPPPLKDLFQTLDGVDAVVTDAGAVSQADFWCLAMSLPLHLGTRPHNIPVDVMPYLRVPPVHARRWHGRLPADRRQVGLVWKGNPLHGNDANRSLPHLSALKPLWSVPHVDFVSLQMGAAAADASPPPVGQPLCALGPELNDFADLAAVVAQLDLVICVDTAIAHLAGALGRPCWVLLPAINVDWRWLGSGPTSPWYPSLTLFRQRSACSWDDTVEVVAQALADWAQPPAQHAAMSAPGAPAAARVTG